MLLAITVTCAALALVMPTMASTRRSTVRVVCQKKLGEVAEGATIYAKNFDDRIIGSPWESGAYFEPWTAQAWGPAVQTWDFFGPLEAQCDLGLIRPSKGDPSSGSRLRSDQYVSELMECVVSTVV